MKLFLFALFLFASPPDDIIVGALENISPAHPPAFAARMAFHKVSGQWEAFKTDFNDLDTLKNAVREFPESVNWTITLAGKTLGQARGITPPSWSAYSHIGLQLLPGDPILPHAGAPSKEFQRWDSEGPVYRPLILASRPNIADPDAWKPVHPDSSYIKLALSKLRDAVQSEDSSFTLKDGDVRTARAFGSKRGQVLFALAIHVPHPQEDQVPSPAQSLHWFVTGPGKSVQFLGSEMVFLDAGDYDGDGQSEVVFMKSGYNRDGYVLFSGDFSHRAEFSWSYH